jgi:hypothetical protein
LLILRTIRTHAALLGGASAAHHAEENGSQKFAPGRKVGVYLISGAPVIVKACAMDLGVIDNRTTLSTQQNTGPSGRFWVFRAEDEIRTRDLLLGKETLYQAEPLPRRWG